MKPTSSLLHRSPARCALAFVVAFVTAHAAEADAQQSFDTPTRAQPSYPSQSHQAKSYPPPQTDASAGRNSAGRGVPAQDEFPIQFAAGMPGAAPGQFSAMPGMAPEGSIHGMQPGSMPEMPNLPGEMAPSDPFGGANAPGGEVSGVDSGAVRAALQSEREDFGVAPQSQLQTTLHGPTPTSIPGGQTITTDRLLDLYRQAAQNGLLVFNALGPGMDLPYAQNAVGAAQAGSFDDQTQQQFAQFLRQVTQGNTARPLVFYCMNTHCWMSYNAALRAIHLGFQQVYWYRGGVEAWQRMQQLSAATTKPINPATQWPAPNQSGY